MEENRTNNQLMIVDDDAKTAVSAVMLSITEKHKRVSRIKTPKPFIKKKMGLEYIEYNYMREIAEREYPGYKWNIMKADVLGSEAYVVHGRLSWYDEGIWREGDVVAAHRIQRKRGTNEFVDIGNDIKAANTDAIKKAFNMFLNIADDVYRNQIEDPVLSENQKSDILAIAQKISAEKYDSILTHIEEGTLYAGNYKSSLAKLNRQLSEVKAS